MLSGASVVLLAAQQTGCASDAAAGDNSALGNASGRCGNAIRESGESCDDGNAIAGDGCSASCQSEPNYVCMGGGPGSCVSSVAAWVQKAYLKASNTGRADVFGGAVALSGDGKILAVAATGESSVSKGIGMAQSDDSASRAGAVYLFAQSGSGWVQQAYIKASNTDKNDAFGTSVALSRDGSTLVVGAPRESSASVGVGANQNDNSAPDAGAAYVFVRSGNSWLQQAYIKASNSESNDAFGSSVSLSADGNVLAVGAANEGSSAKGVAGDQTNNDMEFAGAVYTFARTSNQWAQTAYVKASNTGVGDKFGASVMLSADGRTLAVGAPEESSSAKGVGASQANDAALEAGAVYVFSASGNSWTQQAYIKASNTGDEDHFGASLALSSDGSALAVGAPDESGAAKGVGGNQSSDAAEYAGAVYLFARTGAAWSQQAYIKASNTDANDAFGSQVALSSDGSTLAVSAPVEASAAKGVGGNQADNEAWASGAVYVFTRSGGVWAHSSYIKAADTQTKDEFGSALAMSADGRTLLVGAPYESSAATGINANGLDLGADRAGAAYLIAR